MTQGWFRKTNGQTAHYVCFPSEDIAMACCGRRLAGIGRFTVRDENPRKRCLSCERDLQSEGGPTTVTSQTAHPALGIGENGWNRVTLESLRRMLKKSVYWPIPEVCEVTPHKGAWQCGKSYNEHWQMGARTKVVYYCAKPSAHAGSCGRHHFAEEWIDHNRQIIRCSDQDGATISPQQVMAIDRQLVPATKEEQREFRRREEAQEKSPQQ